MKQLLVKSIVALSLITSNAFADSGEGRSGPDHSGVSIPAKADRGLTLEQFEFALIKCTEEKPAPSLLTQLGFSANEVKVILNAREPRKVEDRGRIYYGTLVAQNGELLAVHTWFDFSRTGPSALLLTLTLQPAGFPYNRGKIVGQLENANILDTVKANGGSITFDISLIKNQFFGEMAVDSFGIPVSKQVYAKIMEFAPSSVVRVSSSHYRSTATLLRYNAQPFIQCMQNQLGQIE